MMQSAIARICVSDIWKAPINYLLRPLFCRQDSCQCHSAVGNGFRYFDTLRGFGFVRCGNGKRQGKRKRGILIVCQGLRYNVHFISPFHIFHDKPGGRFPIGLIRREAIYAAHFAWREIFPRKIATPAPRG